MKRTVLLLLLIVLTSFTEPPTCVVYFDAERKDKVYFSWEVNTDKKVLTYVIQESSDRINFTDIFQYKGDRNKFNVSMICESIYFRLKIYTTKDCYIYSDIIHLRSHDLLEVFPKPSIVYISSPEPGSCYIYDSNNEIVLIQNINDGHNQVPHNLSPGTYRVMVFTENFNNETKILVK